MRILLVEPHPTLAKPLLWGLEEEGMVVELVGDGAEAGVRARSATYDALIVHWGLPQAGGASWVRALRQEGLATPVLMLVPTLTGEQHRLAQEAGATTCLPLPFQLQELVTRLHALCSQNNLTPASPPPHRL